MKTRVYFLDNLRTLMIFFVILLHAGIVYEPILEYVWIVSDPQKLGSLGLVRMYLDLFVMFTLFFISGYLIPISLKRHDTWGFIKSKFKRIMLPWLIAVVTLIPLYKAIFLYSRGLPQQEWYSYFHLFMREGGHAGYYADHPTQGWLWFLPVLFLFQLIYLAMAKSNLLSIKISLKTGVIATFIIGLAYSMLISGLDLVGWHHSPLLHFQNERLLVYFLVFLLGSLCYKLQVFETGRMSKQIYIIANVVLSLSLAVFTVVALNLFFNLIEPGRNYYFVSNTVDRIAYYGTMLLSMLSFLYIFMRTFQAYFDKSTRLMRQLNRNSYSVYVVHMIVIGVVALWLVDVHMPVIVKYLVLAIATFTVSNLIVSAYRWLLRSMVPGSPVDTGAGSNPEKVLEK